VHDKRQVEGRGDGGVGDVIVRGADSAGGDDEVVGVGHAAHGFDDVGAGVGDDFDTRQGDAQGEAEFCEVGRVGVDGLFEGKRGRGLFSKDFGQFQRRGGVGEGGDCGAREREDGRKAVPSRRGPRRL